MGLLELPTIPEQLAEAERLCEQTRHLLAALRAVTQEARDRCENIKLNHSARVARSGMIKAAKHKPVPLVHKGWSRSKRTANIGRLRNRGTTS